jgi:hypothetical protein
MAPPSTLVDWFANAMELIPGKLTITKLLIWGFCSLCCAALTTMTSRLTVSNFVDQGLFERGDGPQVGSDSESCESRKKIYL